MNEELDGMAKLRDAIEKEEWPHTMDAHVWAEKFCEVYPVFDKGDAIGWFANAIMAGYDTAMVARSFGKDIAGRVRVEP